MSFNNIIGHKSQIEYFKKNLIENKISHAIIFEGIAGIGKSRVAYNVAKTLFCDTNKNDACGICRNCIKMDHDNHPDYMVIKPDGNTIKNSQIQLFQEFAMLKPYSSEYKIVVIKNADKMNASSQNRLLKILEEPPAHVIILMITTNREILLPTVISRCQIIKFNGLLLDEIKDYLKTNYEIDNNKADEIARLSTGSLAVAINYLTSEEFSEIQVKIAILLDAINSKQKSKVIELISFFTSNKESILKILDYMILWYRDILLYKKAKIKDFLIHFNELEIIKKYSRNLSIDKLINNIEVIEMTRRKINQHANFDLTIEVMLIKLMEV